VVGWSLDIRGLGTDGVGGEGGRWSDQARPASGEEADWQRRAVSSAEILCASVTGPLTSRPYSTGCRGWRRNGQGVASDGGHGGMAGETRGLRAPIFYDLADLFRGRDLRTQSWAPLNELLGN